MGGGKGGGGRSRGRVHLAHQLEEGGAINQRVSLARGKEATSRWGVRCRRFFFRGGRSIRGESVGRGSGAKGREWSRRQGVGPSGGGCGS